MSESRIDLERLAQLLDARLDEAESERLVAELSQSEDDRLLLGDAAAVLRELEEDGTLEGESGDGDVVGAIGTQLPLATADVASRPAAASPPRLFRRVALAAAAVAVISVGVLYPRDARPVSVDDPRALVALMESPTSTQGAALADVPWSAARGAEDVLAPRARAVRYGAAAVQLELAARRSDTGTVALLARRAAVLLAGVPTSGQAVQIYGAVADSAALPASVLASRLLGAWEAGRAAAGDADASAGAWLEAARVAVAARDAKFFRATATIQLVKTLAARGDLDDETRQAVDRVRLAVEGGGGGGGEGLARDVERILASLGS